MKKGIASASFFENEATINLDACSTIYGLMIGIIKLHKDKTDVIANDLAEDVKYIGPV